MTLTMHENESAAQYFCRWSLFEGKTSSREQHPGETIAEYLKSEFEEHCDPAGQDHIWRLLGVLSIDSFNGKGSSILHARRMAVSYPDSNIVSYRFQDGSVITLDWGYNVISAA